MLVVNSLWKLNACLFNSTELSSIQLNCLIDFAWSVSLFFSIFTLWGTHHAKAGGDFDCWLSWFNENRMYEFNRFVIGYRAIIPQAN